MMTIDENAWDAGYEAGVKDQKRAGAGELEELRSKLAMAEAAIAGRIIVSREACEKAIAQGARLTDHRLKL